MSNQQSSSENHERPPPKERSEPTGIDVSPETDTGWLRLILFIVIMKYWAGSYTNFCKDIGMPDRVDFVHYHCRYYQEFTKWDTAPKGNNKGGTAYSSIRNLIVEVYNSLPFPRHVEDVRNGLAAVGCFIRLSRLLYYLGQLQVYATQISRCLNPTAPKTCEDRLARAIEVKSELDQLIKARKKHPKDDKTKWFYYDQAPFKQTGQKRSMVLGPKGMKVYDPHRVTLHSPALTLHMIVDQDGEIWDYLWLDKGQGLKEITKFLTKAAERLPDGHRAVLYCDRLKAHQNLEKKNNFVWDVRTLPVSSSDSNIIETIFSSLKRYLYHELNKNRNIKKVDELIVWCTKQTSIWWQGYKGDDTLFKHSYHFLKQLIKAKGNLQTVALLDNGFKSTDDLRLKQIPADVE